MLQTRGKVAIIQKQIHPFKSKITLRQSNIAMENPPFVNDFPIGKGKFHCYVRLPECTIPQNTIQMNPFWKAIAKIF